MGRSARRKREERDAKKPQLSEFTKMWRHVDLVRNDPHAFQEEQISAGAAFASLPRARVVSFPKGLVATAPLVDNADLKPMGFAGLPFPITLIDLDSVPVVYAGVPVDLHSGLFFNSRDVFGDVLADAHEDDDEYNGEGRQRICVVRITVHPPGRASRVLLAMVAAANDVEAIDDPAEAYFTAGVESAPDLDHLVARPVNEPYPLLPVLAPLVSALQVLESVNVDLVDRPAPVVTRRFAGQIPHFGVEIKTKGRTQYRYPSHEAGEIAYSHRWEVRGHFKHVTRGPIYEKALRERPEKVLTSGNRSYVRIWCPPFVKGPESKPLLPKLRRVA